MSAFGSVIAVNRTVDVPLAERLKELFVEVIFAPGYEDEALEILTRKADIRILRNEERRQINPGELDYKRVTGGVLVQDKDSEIEERDDMSVATQRHPSEQEWGDLIFAFRIAKHVKSNAIVLARNLATLGVGAGQMSRVDATRIAIEKARGDITGAVIGSDAFYPFPDAVELAIESGVGSELRNPLGITIVGGLLLSQLLTLYTTPVIYLAMERLKARLSGPSAREATGAVNVAAE